MFNESMNIQSDSEDFCQQERERYLFILKKSPQDIYQPITIHGPYLYLDLNKLFFKRLYNYNKENMNTG